MNEIEKLNMRINLLEQLVEKLGEIIVPTLPEEARESMNMLWNGYADTFNALIAKENENDRS